MSVKKIAAVAALIVVAACAVVLWQIGPRNVLGMLRYDQRDEGRLQVGDVAPDVELVAPDGAAHERLSSHIGDRPLVVVFGSFT